MYGKSFQISNELQGLHNPVAHEALPSTTISYSIGALSVEHGAVQLETALPSEQTTPYPPAAMTTEQRSVGQLNKLVDVAATLKTQLPEFAGMTAYGSVVRGNAKQESDVDITVFFDVSQDRTSDLVNHVRKTAPNEIEDLSDVHIFDLSTKLRYNIAIRNALKEKGTLNPQDADISALPISSEIVSEEVKDLLNVAARYDSSKDENKVWAPRNIRALFNMPIADERLKGYQAQVVQDLSRSPYGKRAWQMLAFRAVHFEKGRGNDDYTAYTRRLSFQPIPWSLEEANTMHDAEK